MRKLTLLSSVFLLVLLDQISKLWIVHTIRLGTVVGFIPHLISLTYLRNTGAAFSILENQQWFFLLITLLVLGGAVYYLMKNIETDNIWLLLSLLLIISGGLGNFIDRLRLGYVVDMIHLDFVDFAIFNVADSYLSVGIALLIWALWKEEKNGNSN
ncbi:signal peptidase II [Streptococcus macacae]|uniref:Lipoprotein signal peptidase n=1 Tax=Streptococcus macacae NCTC 11558 TaxID=764298 RepID=G5JZA0_9STRE|nr:signal peptidase II [Streptococcus macacae]EHJ51606.1 signal peptidase II [Streptococcus macacae NCTC 11558]SUN78349.1 lipoprotein signal peptidase [Streptococcus macacae NCTC 11558]